MPDPYLLQLAHDSLHDRRAAAPVAILMTLALMAIISGLLRIALP